MEIISRSNLVFIIDLDTVYDILKTLQKRLAPIDRARQLKLSQLYLDLKKALKD